MSWYYGIKIALYRGMVTEITYRIEKGTEGLDFAFGALFSFPGSRAILVPRGAQGALNVL